MNNNNVYQINKGVMRSIEIKGIRAQYITYLAIGLVGLLLVFAVAYLLGMPTYLSTGLVVIGGYSLFTWVSKMSHTYGEHGLMKHGAFQKVPPAIICRSREVFITSLKNERV